MSFPLNVYLLAAASACLTVLATLPLWRKWCLRSGLVDEPGERKIHDQPIPLAGGLAVMTGLLVPTLLACLVLWCQKADGNQGGSPAIVHPTSTDTGASTALDARSVFLLQYGLGKRAIELAGIFLGAFGILLVGWLDDKHELQPRAKFAGQFLVAALVAASGARITLFVPSIVFSYAVTILWILTLVNAFNFMDNMNGLCAGLGAIGACNFAVIAAADNQYLVALIAFLTFGALLAFCLITSPGRAPFWAMPAAIWSVTCWRCSRSCRTSTRSVTLADGRC